MTIFNLVCRKCGKVVGTRDAKISHKCAVTPPPAAVVPPPVTPPPAPRAAGPAPGTVFVETPALLLDNRHDMIFNGKRFRGVASYGDMRSQILCVHSNYNLTFTNCLFDTCQHADGNGITVHDGGKGVRDITFDHCHFAYQPRMGFECISRRSNVGQGYLRVNLIDCTFAVQGSQAISYDDDSPDKLGAGQCLVHGTVVEGGGATYPNWRRVFELNRVRNMTVTDNFFGAGRDGITNRAMRDAARSGWVFSGNTWDATHVDPRVVPYNNPTVWYQALNSGGGGTFADTIITGPGYSKSWGYFDTVSGADFSGSKVRGAASATPTLSGTCSGNKWPTVG